MNSPDNRPSHPGEYIRRLLTDNKMSQGDLAYILGTSPTNLNTILAQKRSVSPEMSKLLGIALDKPENYFADLQVKYDLHFANAPDPSVTVRAELLKQYSIREMIRRGWIVDGTPDIIKLQLSGLLETDDLADITAVAHAAKKTGYDNSAVLPDQIVWLYRVRQIAKEMPCKRYSQSALESAIVAFGNLTITPEGSMHVPKLLSDAGVRFLMVESLPGAKIDGVCTWLDPSSPVIGISSRFDRIDNFWFVLRHECEHILRKHGQTQHVIDDLGGDNAASDDRVPPEEQVANAAAAEFCVPSDKMNSFIRRKQPMYYERDVLAFSQINGIHPGIVVGQLQFRLNRYDYLRKYQVKIRQFVLPNSIADGWGQTVPLKGLI